MNCPLYTAANMIVSQSGYPLGVPCSFQNCQWFDMDEYECIVQAFWKMFKVLNTQNKSSRDGG